MAINKQHTVAEGLTQRRVFEYWFAQENDKRSPYLDDCNEYDTTKMGEDAATYFCVTTDNGDSEIEQSIFDWAVEFTIYKGVFPRL